MAKLYLSFLGTNDYIPCIYKHHDIKTENVRFVQEATIRLNCTDWSENDRVIIFTTPLSYNLNWKDNGQTDKKSGKKILQPGLETCIKNIKADFSYQQIMIPNGTNEKEIWEIFLKLFDSIHEEDEIIFDITHAFRSIPLLAIVVLNYAKIMKNAALSGIYYGALESLGNINDVKKMPLEKRVVPVLDLTAFDQLMEWSLAADRFIGAGDASHVSALAEHSARTRLSRTKGRDRSQHTIRKMAENLEKFTKSLATCRGRDMADVALRLKQSLEDCRAVKLDNPLNIPLKSILGKIEDQIEPFSGHFIMDGIKASRWCLEHNLIQQSYTILQETLITYFVFSIGKNPEDYSSKNRYRTLANQAVSIFLNKLSVEKWKKDAFENQPVIEKFINFYKTKKILVKLYHNLTGFRNDLNHAGYSDSARSAEKFRKELPGFLKTVETEIKL